MKTVLKYAAAVALTGALAFAAVTPSQAGGGRNAYWATGFGAGSLDSATYADSANNAYAYDGGYGNNAGYGYNGGYGYNAGYGYNGNYGYNAGYGYDAYDSAPLSRGYYYGLGNPYRQQGCGASPASHRFDDCS